MFAISFDIAIPDLKTHYGEPQPCLNTIGKAWLLMDTR